MWIIDEVQDLTRVDKGETGEVEGVCRKRRHFQWQE